MLPTDFISNHSCFKVYKSVQKLKCLANSACASNSAVHQREHTICPRLIWNTHTKNRKIHFQSKFLEKYIPETEITLVIPLWFQN